jgi:hypothetical protein
VKIDNSQIFTSIKKQMIQVKKEGVLAKTLIPFEDSVLNPAAIRDGNFVHMFYAVSRQSF